MSAFSLENLSRRRLRTKDDSMPSSSAVISAKDELVRRTTRSVDESDEEMSEIIKLKLMEWKENNLMFYRSTVDSTRLISPWLSSFFVASPFVRLLRCSLTVLGRTNCVIKISITFAMLLVEQLNILHGSWELWELQMFARKVQKARNCLASVWLCSYLYCTWMQFNVCWCWLAGKQIESHFVDVDECGAKWSEKHSRDSVKCR